MIKRISSIMAAIVFIVITAGYSEASVIYDWVNTRIIPEHDSGCGYILNAQIIMPEADYFHRQTVLDTNFSWTITTLLSDNTFFNTSNWGILGYSVLATLSADRSNINGFHLYHDGEIGVWPTAEIHAHDDDWSSLFFSYNQVRGRINDFTYFDEERHPVTGDWHSGFFGVEGEWRLRAETAPAVPEPGSILLLGLGLVTLLVWRKKSRPNCRL